jgi:YD repeat-containing protein
VALAELLRRHLIASDFDDVKGWSLHYNANNRLTSVTDSYGRTLTIAHSGTSHFGFNELISSVAAPDGLVLTYSYTQNAVIGPVLVNVG